MKYNFQFSNLCGSVYKKGTLVFIDGGNVLLSPVGNRISRFDLKNNQSSTYPFQNRKNIHCFTVSPDETLLISVDEEGHALLVNLHKKIVLHHFNFKSKVYDIKYSPNGRYIAVTHEKKVQVWNAPGRHREFAPFNLYKQFPGQYDDAKCIDWSDDSSFFAVGSRDMSCRIYSLFPIEGFHYVNLLGHRSSVVACFFKHQGLDLYTVSKDGAVIVWKSNMTLEQVKDYLSSLPKKKGKKETYEDMEIVDKSLKDEEEKEEEEEEEEKEKEKEKEKEEEEEEEEEGVTVDAGNDDDVTDDETKQPLLKRSRPMNIIIWTKVAKYLYSQERARVTSVIMHKQSNLLVTGFNNGTFTLHEMPDFNPIHSLSISEYRINSVAVNNTGEWLAFGSSSLGQLLVWEWQSETYILKQQGHLYDMNVMCYSPDGQLIVTGGDDGKVKLWNTSSGFCFATFSEHIAPVTAVVFASSGKVVISASLDGTVRSFDLHRYRNFRTFVSPSPVQFTCLALDPSGEVVCAGSHDTFEIYVWSMQTGRLLEVLAGHEGPVSGLSFSPCRVVLASSSWDKTVKIWDVFENKGNTETLHYNTMALTLAFRPDGKQLSVATLDGQITLWDIDSSIQTGSIEGKNDLELGRRTEDKITAKTLSGTAHFTTLCYTADGQRLLAGGRSKYVCLYDVDHQILLNKFQTSSNKTFEGMNRLLSRQHLTEAGPLELISDEEVDSDEERRLISLPGVKKGDFSSRKTRPEIVTKCLQFSPTGRAWSAVTTEGLLIYTLDNQISFDPFDMSSEVTSDSIKEAIKKRDYSRALVLSLRLNEYPLVLQALEAIPIVEVELVLRDLSETYVQRILPVLSDRMNHSPHLEFYLHWCTTLLSLHTRTLKEKGLETMSFLTDLQKSIVQRQTDLGKLCDTNTYGLQYTLCMSKMEDGTKENAVTST